MQFTCVVTLLVLSTSTLQQCVSSFSLFHYIRRTFPKWMPSSLLSTPSIALVNGKTLAIVKYQDDGSSLLDCELFDVGKARRMADAKQSLDTLNLKANNCSFYQMMRILEGCEQLAVDQWHSGQLDNVKDEIDNETHYQSILSGISPGTKWCGRGDIASKYHDLGRRSKSDICCRAHDHCPVKLKALRGGYGLFNWSLTTMSHCDCDHMFLMCLKEVGTAFADLVGNSFFNVIKMACVRETGEEAMCRRTLAEEQEEKKDILCGEKLISDPSGYASLNCLPEKLINGSLNMQIVQNKYFY